MSCLQYVSGQIRYAQMIALKRSMPLAHSLTGRIVFNGSVPSASILYLIAAITAGHQNHRSD